MPENILELASFVYRSGHYPHNLRVLKKVWSDEKPGTYVEVIDEGGTMALLQLTMIRGAEAALQPLTALYSIVWFDGKPSIRGDVAKALVRSHNEFGGMEFADDDDNSVTCTLRRVTNGGDTVEEVARTFSMADAKRAGLDALPHYKRYPGRMLEWRSFFWALRDMFPDALHGFSITEEARDQQSLSETDDVPSIRDSGSKLVDRPVTDRHTAKDLEGRNKLPPVGYVEILKKPDDMVDVIQSDSTVSMTMEQVSALMASHGLPVRDDLTLAGSINVGEDSFTNTDAEKPTHKVDAPSTDRKERKMEKKKWRDQVKQ